MTSRYAGFEITRTRSGWIGRRRTKADIRQLAPARTLRELQAAIDAYNASLSAEELFA